MSFPTQQDLEDLQGDVVLGFPKKAQFFRFYTITDTTTFKKDLKNLIPLITTTAQVQQARKDIANHKAQQKPGLVKALFTNISFTKQGLAKLGATDDLKDNAFNAGMLKNSGNLGDNGTGSVDNFDPDWDTAFKNEIDVLISVAGDSVITVTAGLNNIDHIVHDSTKQVFKVDGTTRPGKESGHEHFGFKDGISFPGIKALTGLLPGQIEVQPGVLILGQDGDSVKDRPTWAKNGSFLVYRQLSQFVPEFNKFLSDNPIVIKDQPDWTHEEGSELTGARLFGRWKSGAPLDVSPLKDDQALADDPQRNNNFDFSDSLNDQGRCPFAAHIRKTNPRQDLLTLQGATEETLASHMINRQSITFGPEVTPLEAASQKSTIDRGLAFVCYQSSLTNGFEFVQESWANAPNFPPKSNATPGLDPIIGQQNGQPRVMSGLQPTNQGENITLPVQEFVVSKGGAYFFVPSLTALKTKLSA